MDRILLGLLVTFCFSANAAVISVSKVSNLEIGVVVQGESSLVIAPGTVENAQNASFSVRGDADTIYTIILPVSAILAKSGSPNLNLTNFQSFPAAGPNGLLNSKGRSTFFVGATLAPIPTNQPAGSYSGSFTVNVLY